MQCVRLTDPAMLAAGHFAGTRLDPGVGNLAAIGTPALVADIDPATGTTAFLTAVGALTGAWGQTTNMPLVPIPSGGTAAPVQTDVPGASWTLTTTAYAIDFAWLQSSAGAIAHLTVDGQPVKGFDSTRPQGTTFRLYLDGQSHTVTLTYTGDAVLSATLVGTPADSAGTAGLAAALGLSRNGQAVTGQTWTVRATGTTAIEVLNQASAVQGALTVGQASDTLIPGVTLSLAAGTWDATSVATVVTTAPVLTVATVTTYTGLLASATYTSPVLDSGVPNTAWPLVELVQGPLAAPGIGVQFGIGETPQPDPSWVWATLRSVTDADADGNPWNRVVYAGATARGRYAQAVGSLDGSVRIWASDLRTWSWRPETDPFLRQRFPPGVYSGQTVTVPFLTALAALWAVLDELADALQDGASVTNAGGQYLTNWGTQFSRPRLIGEGDSAYRSRLASLFAGRGEGGSRPFLQQVLTGALGTPVQVTQTARTTQEFALGTTGILGTAALGRSAKGAWRWQVRVPFAGLQVAPETALDVITALRPPGSIVSVLWT